LKKVEWQPFHQPWRKDKINVAPRRIAVMLYIDLFKSLERARWNMETDIPWD